MFKIVITLFLTSATSLAGTSLLLAADPVTPPRDRIIVYDENPFAGSPRGLFEVGFDKPSSFLVNVPIDTSRNASRLFTAAYRRSDGFVYTASEAGGIWRIDISTGALIPFAPGGIRSITFSPIDGLVYGVSGGTNLIRYDLDTRVRSVIGTIPALDNGIAAGPDGLIYSTQQTGVSRLIAINPITLAVTQFAPNNAAPIADLDFTSDGRLFGISWQDANVYEFDVTTGASTLVAQLPNNHNGAMGILAIPAIPEPATVICIILASPIVLARRRR